LKCGLQSTGDSLERIEIGPPPPHDDQPRFFEQSLPGALPDDRGPPAFILEVPVGFADHAELIPVEVATAKELAELVADLSLRFRLWETARSDPKSAQGLER
jgi:hypothetical protein